MRFKNMRRAHGLENVSGRNVSSALIMATTMMYIRLLAIFLCLTGVWVYSHGTGSHIGQRQE
jgi:hypothetical protein